MKTKILAILFGIVLMAMTYSTLANELQVPVIVEINNSTLRIKGENLDWVYSITNLSNLTNYSTVLNVKLTGENAETTNSLIRSMVVECNESLSFVKKYIECNVTTTKLNETETELGFCKGNTTNLNGQIENWKTEATKIAVSNPNELVDKFNNNKWSLWWLIILGVVGTGLGMHYWNKKRGVSKGADDFQEN